MSLEEWFQFVLLQDVIYGHEVEDLLPVGGDVPQDAGLLLPVLLLQRVVCVEPRGTWGLGPRIGEDEAEVFLHLKFFVHLGIDFAGIPSFVLAELWVLWKTFSFLNCIFAERPETDSKDYIFPPVLAEHERHPLEHGLEPCRESCCSSIKQ